MPQYSSKIVAMAALKRYFFGGNIITERPSEGTLSPAEDLLLGALCRLLEEREAHEHGQSRKFGPRKERAYKHLKSIARALKLFPISEEVRQSYRVRQKMSSATGRGIGELWNTRKDKWGVTTRGEESGKWSIIHGPISERK